MFGLLGPNGAGKTTTILMLLGLTEPTSGTARVGGLDPVHDPLRVKSQVGYVPDNVGFYDDLSARANLRYTAQLNRLPARLADERIDQLLADVGLTDAADRKVGGYSRGMRQRLGVADALVKNPALLVLDEPTVNIDPEGVRELLLLVERLRTDQGMTVLLSSHLLHQVQQVCDRIGIFVRGRLVTIGTIDELAARLADRFAFSIGVSGLDDTAPRARVDDVTSIRRDEGRWTVDRRARRPRRPRRRGDRRRRAADAPRRAAPISTRSTTATSEGSPMTATVTVRRRGWRGRRGTATAVPRRLAHRRPQGVHRPHLVGALRHPAGAARPRRAGGGALGERPDPRHGRRGDADAVDLPLPVHPVAGAGAGVPRVPRHPRAAARHRLRLRRDQRRARRRGRCRGSSSQPIHRDEIINGKFVAGLAAIALTLAASSPSSPATAPGASASGRRRATSCASSASTSWR